MSEEKQAKKQSASSRHVSRLGTRIALTFTCPPPATSGLVSFVTGGVGGTSALG